METVEQLEELKKAYKRARMPRKMQKSIVGQIEKVQTVMEGMSFGGGAYELGDQWVPIDYNGGGDHMHEYRIDAWDYGLNSGWSIKPAAALRGWAGSKGIRYHSDNPELDILIKRITKSPFSNVFDIIQNFDHEFFDGAVVLKMTYLGDDQVIIRDADINRFDIDRTVRSFIDGETAWMHTIKSQGQNGDFFTYYPDVNFFPNEQLMKVVEAQIRQDAEDTKFEYEIVWGTKIFTHRFNNGMPVFYPITKFIKCLEAVIMLQSAVLQSIAAVASYASIDDESERYDAYVALNKARPGPIEGQMMQDRVDAILRETDAGTAVTSGKISAVNLNIAMLQTTSALYKLLVDSVYNSIPGATPTDWSELPKFSLGDQGSQQASKEVQAALLRQSEHGQMYRKIIESAFTMLIMNGQLVPGVSVLQYPVSIPGDSDGMVNHFVLEYPSQEEELQVSWPEVTTRNFKETVEAIVEGVTLGGRIGKPLGRPSDIAKMLETLGFELHLDSDDWEDYRLTQNPVAASTTNTDGSQVPEASPGEAQESFQSNLDQFTEILSNYKGYSKRGK